MTTVLRYAAFTRNPSGGNPAGVVLDADLSDAPALQAVATDLGYSETAFLRATGPARFAVRFFSPAAEVPFCGHATIASAVALAERYGPADVVLDTVAGTVSVRTHVADGGLAATLTSVPPQVIPVAAEDVAAVLDALGWELADLDPELPPRAAYAGAWHLILPVATRQRLADLRYDFPRLTALMLSRDWTTVHLVWREDELTHHARDPFPVGGVVEDPATGAAAAAYGAYLRELGEVSPPAQLTIHQGDDLGRPSILRVDLMPEDPRIQVTGYAVAIA